MATPISYHFTFILLIITEGVLGATFTFTNKCDFTVWPGILASAGTDKLDSTGFELPKGSSRVFQAPTGWSGRFWGRTGCTFDASGRGSCSTGDCGSGELECNGAGAAPPATLAEFTLGSGSQDFYDVSLVDGYNLPMIVEGSGDRVRARPPGALRTSTVGALPSSKSRVAARARARVTHLEVRSIVAAARTVHRLHASRPCTRSCLSRLVRNRIATLTMTLRRRSHVRRDYTITFCASLTSSLKSSRDSGSGSGSNPVGSSLFADLASGDSTKTQPSISIALQSMLILVISMALTFRQLH